MAVVPGLQWVLLDFGACWWDNVWNVVLDCYFERNKKKRSLEAGNEIGKSIPNCLPNVILKLQGKKTLSFVCVSVQ